VLLLLTATAAATSVATAATTTIATPITTTIATWVHAQHRSAAAQTAAAARMAGSSLRQDHAALHNALPAAALLPQVQ
jgi:hypothetical protein